MVKDHIDSVVAYARKIFSRVYEAPKKKDEPNLSTENMGQQIDRMVSDTQIEALLPSVRSHVAWNEFRSCYSTLVTRDLWRIPFRYFESYQKGMYDIFIRREVAMHQSRNNPDRVATIAKAGKAELAKYFNEYPHRLSEDDTV